MESATVTSPLIIEHLLGSSEVTLSTELFQDSEEENCIIIWTWLKISESDNHTSLSNDGYLLERIDTIKSSGDQLGLLPSLYSESIRIVDHIGNTRMLLIILMAKEVIGKLIRADVSDDNYGAPVLMIWSFSKIGDPTFNVVM